MIYFSQLLKKKVITEDGLLLGTFDDFVILISSIQPKVTKLVIKKNKEKLFIPTDFLLKINDNFVIKKNYLLAQLEANELFVLRNILDKQIIDLTGDKIVRVNDVVFQKYNSHYYLAGVDIGLPGILRRLGLEKVMAKILKIFNLSLKSTFLSWGQIHPLELARGQVVVKRKEEKLEKLLPEDLADYLEKTSIENAKKIIKVLDKRKAREVINSLNLNYQSALMKKLKIDEAVDIIQHTEPDEAVDILLTFSFRKRSEIINRLPEDFKKKIIYLLKFSLTPVGEIMTTEYIKVKPENTVQEVIGIVKKEAADFSFLTTIYVVNDQNQLIGVFNLHELLLQNLDTFVYQFMQQNLVVVHLKTPKEIVLHKMLKYTLQVLPVVDNERKLIGVVTIDDLNNFIREKLKI